MVQTVAMGVETVRRVELSPLGASARRLLAEPRWSLFLGLIVLNILDLITTAFVLTNGGAERNPFVQPFIDNLWQIGLLKGAVLALIAMLLTRCPASRITELSLAATTGWYLAVVAWNVAVLALL